MFSPPPPPRSGSIPPLPQIPLPVSRIARVPLPPRAPASGLIRANEQPFAFEHRFTPPSRIQADVRRSRAPAPAPLEPPLAPAPPSHHVPNMGFGGAILRRNAEETARNRRRSPDNFLNRHFHRFGDWLGWRDDHSIDDLFDTVDFDFNHGFNDLPPPEHDHFGAHFRRMQPEYKPVYTHPEPPADGFGFTHNFALPTPTQSPKADVIVIDDDSEPNEGTQNSSHPSSVTTALVCAHCLDPLVLGGGSTSDQEAKDSKVWGLRCGHLLDGKCVMKLMRGGDPAQPSESGSGHGESADIGLEDRTRKSELMSGKQDKGKRKAVAQVEDEYHTGIGVEVGIGIRSRLRPRRTINTANSPISSAVHSPPESLEPGDNASSSTAVRPRRVYRSLATTPTGPLHPSLATRSRKGKGKQKDVETDIEERHEWYCPVARCGHKHMSVKVKGKGWVMDSQSGAIGIFA